MPSNKTMRIDADKLYEELQKRHLSAREVSLKIGYHPAYINQALVRGKISNPGVVALKNMFNIDRESYELVEEPAVPEPEYTSLPPVPVSFELDYDRLGEIIFKAVYEAVKKAWSE